MVFVILFIELKIELGLFFLIVGELYFVIVFVMDEVEYVIIGVLLLIIVDIFLFII